MCVRVNLVKKENFMIPLVKDALINVILYQIILIQRQIIALKIVKIKIKIKYFLYMKINVYLIVMKEINLFIYIRMIIIALKIVKILTY